MPSNLKVPFTLTDHPYATRSKHKTTRSKHKKPLHTQKQPSKTTTLDASPKTNHRNHRSNPSIETPILHPDLTLDDFFPALFDTNGYLPSNEVQHTVAEMSSLGPLEDPSKTNSETDSLFETFFSV